EVAHETMTRRFTRKGAVPRRGTAPSTVHGSGALGGGDPGGHLHPGLSRVLGSFRESPVHLAQRPFHQVGGVIGQPLHAWITTEPGLLAARETTGGPCGVLLSLFLGQFTVDLGQCLGVAKGSGGRAARTQTPPVQSAYLVDQTVL